MKHQARRDWLLFIMALTAVIFVGGFILSVLAIVFSSMFLPS